MNRTLTPPTATAPSFERSAKPLLLALKPSRLWLVFLTTLHLLALVAAAIAVVPITVKGLLTVFTICSLLYQIHHYRKNIQLVWRNGNRWFINDDDRASELYSVNFLSRWLVILTLAEEYTDKTGFKRFSVNKQKFIIPADSLDKNTFRLLRVRLRIEGHELLNPQQELIK